MTSNHLTPDTPATRQRRAEGVLLLTTLIWGGTFGATKVLLNGGITPLGLLSWRFGIAAVVFPIVFHRAINGNITLATAWRGATLGTLLYLGFALQTVGLDSTSSSRSGFITALYVVFTPLLQIIITRRLPSRNVLVGVALVLLGLWGLTAPGGGIAGLLAPWRAGGFGAGDALTLGCAFSFSIYIILMDRFAPQAGDIASMTWMQLLTCMLLVFVHCAITGQWSMPHTPVDWSLILYLAIFATVLSTYWQTRYQSETTPARASVIFTMESVFAAVFATAFLNETMGVVGVAGGVLIVAGLLVTELGGR